MIDGKRAVLLSVFSFIAVFAILYTALAPLAEPQQGETPDSERPPSEGIYVEVYAFYTNQACEGCEKLREFSKKTVDEYFADEIESGRLVYDQVNADLPENSEIAEKYEVVSSSLFIGTYTDGELNKEQDFQVWFKTDDEAAFKEYLKGVIEKRLAGDLSD